MFDHNISLYKNCVLVPSLMCLGCYVNLNFPMTYAFIATSLQILWQTFIRNVPWVVRYQTYHFWPILWILVVAMATERLNLPKHIQNSTPQKPYGGLSWNCSAVQNITFCKSGIFIAVVQLYSWLWQLSFHRLIMGKLRKWHLFPTLVQYFDKSFFRNVQWVFDYETYIFCRNLSNRSVVMATKSLNLWDKK